MSCCGFSNHGEIAEDELTLKNHRAGVIGPVGAKPSQGFSPTPPLPTCAKPGQTASIPSSFLGSGVRYSETEGTQQS